MVRTQGRETDRQTDGQTDRQTDGQTDRQDQIGSKSHFCIELISFKSYIIDISSME